MTRRAAKPEPASDDVPGPIIALGIFCALVVVAAIAEWRANAAVTRAKESAESVECWRAGGEYVRDRFGYTCVGDGR